MRIKEGVSIEGIKPEMLFGHMIVGYTFEQEIGLECVVTSGSERFYNGKPVRHKKNSRHWIGMALDYRRRHIPDYIFPKLVEKLKKNLGENYYVRVESTHLHIAYKPKS